MYKEAQGYVRLTFQLADLRLTVRPLLVTVHFIRMKKSRLVLCSLLFFPKLLAGNKKKQKQKKREMNTSHALKTSVLLAFCLFTRFFFCFVDCGAWLLCNRAF